MNSKRTKTLVFSMFLILAIAVPSGFMSQANAIDPKQSTYQQFGNIFSDPSAVPGVIGGILGGVGGFQGNILGSIFTMIFGQIMNFSDQEILPGQNVYVFHANASGSTTTSQPYSHSTTYTTYAPYADKKGNYYWVTVSETYNVNIMFSQAAQIVIVLWDHDGSLVKAILKVLDVAKAGIALSKMPATDPNYNKTRDAVIQKAADTIAWMLVHVNDIITGDEQLIFQPSYYWSYKITGDYSNSRVWHYSNNGSVPVVLPSASQFTNTTQDSYLESLLKPTVSVTSKTIYDSGFLFHIFQLWMRKFQVNINMGKLTGLIALAQQNGSAVSPDMLSNLLEGVDIEFTFTQHHLLGGSLFQDVDGNGVPTVNYTTTPYQYTDSEGVKNVTVPTTNEFRYMLDLGNPGTVVVSPPAASSGSVAWGIEFQNPVLEAIPVGLNTYDAIFSGKNYSIPCTKLKFGFTFTPTISTSKQPPAVNGKSYSQVTVNEGKVKLLQEFGQFTLPPALQSLDLAVIYFSQIFNFNLKYNNLQNATANAQSSWVPTQDKKQLDFLNESTGAYFGSIDIAGPSYTLANGSSYAASTEIVPFAFFSYTYSGQQNIANDAYSMGQGEAGFRTQSLYIGITSAWAFYLVAYPHWGGQALVHDPTFSIFMTMQTETPWGIILMIVVIGVLAVGCVTLFIRNKSHMSK